MFSGGFIWRIRATEKEEKAGRWDDGNGYRPTGSTVGQGDLGLAIPQPWSPRSEEERIPRYVLRWLADHRQTRLCDRIRTLGATSRGSSEVLGLQQRGEVGVHGCGGVSWRCGTWCGWYGRWVGRGRGFHECHDEGWRVCECTARSRFMRCPGIPT